MEGTTELDRILDLAEDLGMTQEALAERAGLGEGRISKWKKGQGRPYFWQVAAMAGVVGVSLDELAGRVAPKPQTPEEVVLWRIIHRMGAGAVLAILFDAIPRPRVELELEPPSDSGRSNSSA